MKGQYSILERHNFILSKLIEQAKEFKSYNVAHRPIKRFELDAFCKRYGVTKEEYYAAMHYEKTGEVKKVDRYKTKRSEGYKVPLSSKLKYKIKAFCDKDNPFSAEDLKRKFGQNPVCRFTGRPINYDDLSTYSFDHIVPKSKNGNNSLNNLQLVCNKANIAKGNMSDEEFINFCKEVVSHCMPI